MLNVKGHGYTYFETGTEGVLWAVEEDGKKGYDALNVLQKGDAITVYDLEDPNKVIWEGIVDLEYERNNYVYNSDYPDTHKQQAIFGFWIHGLQRNLPPETWADFFFKQFPMTLTREEKSQ